MSVFSNQNCSSSQSESRMTGQYLHLTLPVLCWRACTQREAGDEGGTGALMMQKSTKAIPSLCLPGTHSWPCFSLQPLHWCVYIGNGGREGDTFLCFDWTWERGVRKDKEGEMEVNRREGHFQSAVGLATIFCLGYPSNTIWIHVSGTEVLILAPRILSSPLVINRQHLPLPSPEQASSSPCRVVQLGWSVIWNHPPHPHKTCSSCHIQTLLWRWTHELRSADVVLLWDFNSKEETPGGRKQHPKPWASSVWGWGPCSFPSSDFSNLLILWTLHYTPSLCHSLA